jgi:HAD superfamily hydrolase (TIGR01509 family)
MDVVQVNCKPNFIHEYALSFLKSKGFMTAVCSNSVRNSVETMMDKAGLLKYLDLILSNEDVTHGKPDPEMYLKAIDHFGLSPEECLVVEDNENGIRAAQASGANLMIVKDPSETTLENLLNAVTNQNSASLFEE